MYKERFSFAVQHFAVSFLFLTGLFCTTRIIEFILISISHTLPENIISIMFAGFGFDIWYSLVLAIFIFPFYLLLYVGLGTFTRFLLGFLFLVFILVYMSLVKYYTITLLPLGADFWGYSMQDIQTTVSSSAGLELVSFLPFAILLTLFFFYYNKFQEVFLPRWALISYYGIAVMGMLCYMIWTPSASWFRDEVTYTMSVNKMAYFMEKSATLYSEQNEEIKPMDVEYPFMHAADTADVLSPYFNKLEKKPNIVFLIIEGLGGTFVGPNAYYGGCTPFLDSLAQHSLYWQYTLSTTGRTFGVLPSLLGSLPYSDKGFMETGHDMPNHLTLLSLLKQRGYTSHYFYGGNTHFDLQDVFLEQQGVDYILGENKFPPGYQKLEATSEGFSWGYSDGDVFKRSLELLPDHAKNPSISVYLTLNTHEPFRIPDQQKYLDQLKTIAATKSAIKQQQYAENPAEFSSLLYTDNAIRNLMERYRVRTDYANTIFIITGDHRMIPVPQLNRIDRFHVPLIVFSPLLKRAKQFSAVNTHHDVTPTLLSFLQHQTDMVFPDRVHWLGRVLDTTSKFHSTRKIALMRNKNELIDYLDGTLFFSNDILYSITPLLDLEVVNDSKLKKKLQDELADFKQKNQYVISQNKLYDKADSVIKRKPEFILTPQEIAYLQKIGVDTLTDEELLAAAQREIKANRYDNARLIAKKGLMSSPNYTDMRLLIGRSYQWQGDYHAARIYFEKSIQRSPSSEQSWRALIENEIKFDHYGRAIEKANEAYALFKSNDFLVLKKKAQSLKSSKLN